MTVSVYDSMTLCLGDCIKERSGAAWKENRSTSEGNATELGREARANGAGGLPGEEKEGMVGQGGSTPSPRHSVSLSSLSL